MLNDDEKQLQATKEREVTACELDAQAIAIRQSASLEVLSNALRDIATFITQGGLTEVLSGFQRSAGANAILGGLAAHDGRDALDARVLGQNAIEINKQVEKVFDKFHEALESRRRGEIHDPEIHDGESDFAAWVKKQKEKQGEGEQ